MPANKSLVPIRYPVPVCIERPWECEARLNYSSSWLDQGSYRMYSLAATDLDFKFVQNLYSLNPLVGYEIEEIILLSDESDEQAFITGIDLLQKKHGSEVHGAKWKPKNQKPREQQESVQQVEERKLIRAQLKMQRYRSPYVPNVKLLALWQGTSIRKIKQLGIKEFSNLSGSSDESLGKGYYGIDHAGFAYTKASQQYGANPILMLNWYAGKVIYPVISGDEKKIKAQPHYANHDLHFAAKKQLDNFTTTVAGLNDRISYHETVVFDNSQILPRYLVSLKPVNGNSLNLMQELLSSAYRSPQASRLLFQPDLSYVTSLLRKISLEEVQSKLFELTNIQQSKSLTSELNGSIDQVVNEFLGNLTKEVLLLTLDDPADQIILGRYLERLIWNYYQVGQAIPLFGYLPEVIDLNGDLVEQILIGKGLSARAIYDLKNYCEFNLILAGYSEIHRKIPLIKNNRFNRTGGFKGKVIITCQTNVKYEDYLFYPDGVLQKQANFLQKYQVATLSKVECLRQLKVCTNLDPVMLQLPKERSASLYEEYKSKRDSLDPTTKLLLPAVGGELKPWEYDSTLRYSPDWIDKGAYKLHPVNPGSPDHMFLTALYEKSKMPGYEIDEAYIISDFAAEQAFTANLAILACRANNQSTEPDQTLQAIDHLALREQIMQRFKHQTYTSLLAHSVDLLPLWHGTGPMAARGIATSGFASLALVDSGFFGKGLYGSNSSEYSYRVYARGYNQEDGLLLLSWYSAQSVYPVVYDDMSWLMGQANYKHHDSHFMPVVPMDPNNPDEVNYQAIKEGEQGVYEEFVAFQTAQVLPRYILSLRDLTTKEKLPGMAKFLAAPKVDMVLSHKLYQKGLSWAIAKLRHAANEERLQDPNLSSCLELYIPNQAVDDENIGKEQNKYYLFDKLKDFLLAPLQEFWFIQGNSGSGKSLFGRYLEMKYWESYQDGELIPMFIPLSQIADPKNGLIQAIMELKGIPIETIIELKTNKKFLFVLDGSDELVDQSLIQRERFNEHNGWKGKIIITGRNQCLNNQQLNLISTRISKIPAVNGLIRSFMLPFTPIDIINYIEAFCNLAVAEATKFPVGSQKLTAATIIPELNRFSGLNELIKEPFLLFLTLNILPTLISNQQGTTVRKCDLYEAFANHWFARQFDKAIEEGIELNVYETRAAALKSFENYTKDLAFNSLLTKGNKDRVLQTMKLTDLKHCFLGLTPNIINLLLRCIPIKKVGTNYLFIHKSFQEYFVAKKILDELLEDQLSLENLSIQKSLLTKEQAIIDFMVDYLTPLDSEISKILQAKLLKLIKIGQQIRSINKLAGAANAMTILNAARLSFSGMDFSKINLRGANLSGGIFDHTNFSGADLSSVNFQGAWLRQSDFTNADFTGASFGELANLEHSFEKITCCKISVDGKYLALAGKKQNGNYTILLYDAVTLEEINQLGEQTSAINCLAFDNTGSLLSTGSQDGLVRIWNLVTNTENKFKTKHNITTITFNNNVESSLSLAIGSFDGIVSVWDMATFSCSQKFTEHTKEITGLCFTLDGKTLISGSMDGSVMVWNLVTLAHKRLKHRKEVTSIALNVDNSLIITGSSDSNIYVWDVATFSIKQKLEGHTGGKIRSLAFNATGSLLVSSGYDCSIRIWDMENFSCQNILAGHLTPVNSLNFNVNTSLLISGTKDEIRFWDVARLISYNQKYASHSCSVTSIATYGSLAASAGNDRAVCFWDLASLSFKFKLANYTAREITSVAFNETGTKLAISSLDGKIYLLDPRTKCSKYVNTNNAINCITFNSDGTLLAAGYKDGNISFWDVTLGDIEPQFINFIKGHNNQVTTLKFNPVVPILATGSDDGIHLWDATTFSSLAVLKASNTGIASIIFNIDGSTLIAGNKDGSVDLWDMKTFNLITSFRAHTKSITSLACNADGLLATASTDGSIKLWKIKNAVTNLVTIENNFVTYSLSWFLAPNTTEAVLMSGDSDSQVRMWHYASTQNYLNLAWCSTQNVLNTVGAKLDGARIALDNFKLLTQRQAVGTAKIIELETPECLYEAANEQLRFQEFTKAFELFSLAAAKNYPKAKTSLGTFYAETNCTGDVVPEDYGKAMNLFTEAATAGHERAQKNLEILKHKLKLHQ